MELILLKAFKTTLEQLSHEYSKETNENRNSVDI